MGEITYNGSVVDEPFMQSGVVELASNPSLTCVIQTKLGRVREREKGRRSFPLTALPPEECPHIPPASALFRGDGCTGNLTLSTWQVLRNDDDRGGNEPGPMWFELYWPVRVKFGVLDRLLDFPRKPHGQRLSLPEQGNPHTTHLAHKPEHSLGFSLESQSGCSRPLYQYSLLHARLYSCFSSHVLKGGGRHIFQC
ncbi:hypothetical protein BJX99DRAFT_90160 [Aspergillus californicus]